MENQVLVAQSCHLHNRQTKPANGKPSRQLGFTLVELGIGLVIIGLLIGGILVGQSLVESAKVNSVIREFQQYEIGVTQFKEKFRYLPGDHPQGSMFNSLCTGSSCNGNGDGNIVRIVVSPARYEVRNVWYQLQSSGLDLNLPFTTTGDSFTASWVAGDNFPRSKYSKNTFTVISTIDATWGISNYNAAGQLGKLGIALMEANSLGAIKPADALALDKKIDDGVPQTGFFISSDGSTADPTRRNCLTTFLTGNYKVSYNENIDGCYSILALPDF